MQLAKSTIDRLRGAPNAPPNKLLSATLGVPLQLRELTDLIDDNDFPEVTRVNVLAQELPLEDPEVVVPTKAMDMLNVQKRKSCASTSEEYSRAAKKNLAKSSTAPRPRPSRNPALPKRYSVRTTSKSDVSISATDSSGQNAPHPKRKAGTDRPKIIVAGISEIGEIVQLVKAYNLSLLFV